MTEEAQVIQADRDAAIALLEQQDIRNRMDGTFHDWDNTVQAFARHRIAAEREATERAAKLCDAREEMRVRLFEKNGADINAHKAVEAEMIAGALRRNEHMEG